jgi:calcineurin-like phosphoesterase family protein
MTLFFTSDLHLGHVRCATEFRGFASVEAHNETIIENWNTIISDTDIVYIVGDVCMGRMDESLPLAARLSGYKFLIPGNHDRMHPSYHHKGDQLVKRLEWKSRYADEAGITTMARQVFFAPQTDDSGDILICHFPFEDDHVEYANEPRYPEYRPVDDGKQRLIHGHIHDLRRESTDGRQVNVGVDVWDFAPVSWDRLRETMNW